MKRVKKAVNKDDPTKAEHMLESKPVYTLDHIVRERWGVGGRECCVGWGVGEREVGCGREGVLCG